MIVQNLPDNDDIEKVLLEHYRALNAYVTRRFPGRLRPFFEEDDVVHDVCVNAYRNFQISRPQDPRSWLLKIAANRMKDLLRRLRKLNQGTRDVTREDDLSRDDQDTVMLLQDLVVYRRTPSASAIRHELLVALEKALQSISERHEKVIRLRYLDGMSTAQAAGRLGISEDAIAHLLKRALAAIRGELSAYMTTLSWTT